MRAHLVINLVETLISMGRLDAAETELGDDPRGHLPVGGENGRLPAR
jgi:hypothetical protein